MKEYKITVFTENTVGVLNRITNIFTRRKINIESLRVAETHHKGISRFTIVALSDYETMEKVKKHIERIVEVLKADFNDRHRDVDEELKGLI
ncbi:Acetolactate synthase small subunit [Mucinivorans hirudinis]|uniref:Acetolactate synthase small subunit n=1 Tax=Mucinivorans hirudinis TaxID=1433126 RepID=A0A060R9W8_9BACT|nr:Acetolactate synthase small subunit [Mucinivorans hirudinis]